MILMIDNYDSFTYNVVHFFYDLGVEVEVVRNDELEAELLCSRLNRYKGICFSPGPSNPDNAGITLEMIDRCHKRIPLLGICLGHQSIAQYFGAKIVIAKKIMHGKVSKITHNSEGIFSNISNNFDATRYHSLVADKNTDFEKLNLKVTARSEDDDEVMGLQHRDLPIFGLQFHPESILSQFGHDLLKNFCDLCGE